MRKHLPIRVRNINRSIMQSVASMKLIREVAKYLPTLLLLAQAASSQILELDVGTIQGSVLTTRSGEPFNAFRRIPYAEPPIGTFRFTAPQPKANWSSVLDCTAYGPMCMQNDRWNGMLDLREDCLFLNVFTKNLPPAGNFELKPVIAFLHGGGFELGSSIEYGPELLMERDIVLVTIQYRLGAFGSLAVETREIPGNANFKDQNLALRWIKSHIIKFGGDPARVTLAGLSAGSHSATAHMISPMSKGLFKNVIAVSGAMPWQRNLDTHNIETAKALAARINCPTEPTAAMVQCLTAVSLQFLNLRMITNWEFSGQLWTSPATWSSLTSTAQSCPGDPSSKPTTDRKDSSKTNRINYTARESSTTLTCWSA